MVVIGSTIMVTGGLYAENHHPREGLTVNINPLPLINICYNAINHEIDFHLRSKSLLDLPRSLLSVVLSQNIQINVQNYQDIRKLALSCQEMEISKCLLDRICNFCNKYNLL